jgi:hypothetical protein
MPYAGCTPEDIAHRLRIVRHGPPLGRQALDRLGSAVRAAGAGGKITDALQIGLKWRAVGHGEDAIVAFSLATARLLDVEYADWPALQDDAGIRSWRRE